MTKLRPRGELIRQFILENVDKHPNDIGKIATSHFKVSRQAVNKHLQKLTAEATLTESGNTRSRVYKLAPESIWDETFQIISGLGEDTIWNRIKPLLGGMPDNVIDIWHYGFTEMVNNAIDHSEGSTIQIQLKKTAISSQIMIVDNGLGIFKKIQYALDLPDIKQAVLELAKGKFTTDPKHHSGQGIFFTSRMFDSFTILSGGIFFDHDFNDPEDWIEEDVNMPLKKGTVVLMKLKNHTSCTTKKIFDAYTFGDNYEFNKTTIPVKLTDYGEDNLISRSQAKRLLSRVELFKVVTFDFADIKNIGQAFADEIFRVFANQHPDMYLIAINTTTEVQQMIDRAKASQIS